MKRHIIFVGGVHGVGKTELCKQLNMRIGIDHVSASTLIRQSQGEFVERQKKVEHVEDNQTKLLVGIDQYAKDHSWFLLDGHFCLINKDGGIEYIPLAVFERIAPLSSILLIEDPLIISKRLRDRDNTIYNTDIIKRLQDSEVYHAKYICSQLNIPLLIQNSSLNVDNDVITFINIHDKRQ